MSWREEFIVGLDIGTTKVAAVVGEATPDGVNVVGLGTHPSTGLSKGVVANIDATVTSIQRAIDEAEQMAGCHISQVHAGIAGGHIMSFNSDGMVGVRGKEVRDADVRAVIDNARAVAIPADREVIHVLPQEFIVDAQDGIRDPVGMSGVRLEARVHVVTAAQSCAENIVKCCTRCSLDVRALVLQPLASSEAVLHPDEKELGVALVDIGGGTTDFTLYANGAVVHTAVVPLGGQHLTYDLAYGLRTPRAEAERIKQRYGCASVDLIGGDETIEVPSVGGRAPRQVARRVLGEILEPRVEQVFEVIKKEIARAGYEDLLGSGVVLTGGTSALEGIVELGEQVLGLPVRRADPRGIGGLTDLVASPAYATGVGLVLYGARHGDGARAGRGGGALGRLGGWLKEIF